MSNSRQRAYRFMEDYSYCYSSNVVSSSNIKTASGGEWTDSSHLIYYKYYKTGIQN